MKHKNSAEVCPDLAQNAESSRNVQQDAKLDSIDEVSPDNVDESSNEGGEVEWKLSIVRIVHPGVVTPVHQGELVTFCEHQWETVESHSFLINIHRGAEKDPESVS